MRRVRKRLALLLAPALIRAALRVLSWTVRIELRDADPLLERWRTGEPTLLAFWHNRVLMMPLAYRGRGICILNSPSRDGEIATRALAGWGIRAVRGSASRGGAEGFLQLLRAYRRGSDLALVPDGPRGPRYVAKPGVVHLARATGATMFPVSYGASRFVQLRSWDRLLIPLPFARVVFVVGEPITVPRGADHAVEEFREILERRLNEITETAEQAAGGPVAS